MEPIINQQPEQIESPTILVSDASTPGFWRRNRLAVILGILGPIVLSYFIFIPGAILLFAIPLFEWILGFIKLFFLWPIYVGMALKQYWMLQEAFFFVFASIPGLLVTIGIDIAVLIGIGEAYRRWSRKGVSIVLGVLVGVVLIWAVRNAWISPVSRVFPSVCAFGSEDYYRDECFTNAAVAQNDYNLCTRVSYNPYWCLEPFITADRPDDFCRIFPPGSNTGDNCTITLAGLKHNPAICDQIAGNAKNTCLSSAASQ